MTNIPMRRMQRHSQTIVAKTYLGQPCDKCGSEWRYKATNGCVNCKRAAHAAAKGQQAANNYRDTVILTKAERLKLMATVDYGSENAYCLR